MGGFSPGPSAWEVPRPLSALESMVPVVLTNFSINQLIVPRARLIFYNRVYAVFGFNLSTRGLSKFYFVFGDISIFEN